ncbi:MAG: hypothetical protein GX312_03570 [Candidatus Phytoplasma sp.]|nr:hypothetical protein [Phytoplasma sp.]
MEKKMIYKNFFIPILSYLFICSLIYVFIELRLFNETINIFLSGSFLAIGVIPIIAFMLITKKLELKMDIKLYYTFLGVFFLLPIILMYTIKQNIWITIIAALSLIFAAVITFVVNKTLNQGKEKITNILHEIPKNATTRKIITILFIFSYIVLNLWYGWIKPTYITIEAWPYELTFIALIALCIIYFEYQKAKYLPSKSNYFISVLLLILYMVIPNLYINSWYNFISYTIIQVVAYYSLELLGYADFSS